MFLLIILTESTNDSPFEIMFWHQANLSVECDSETSTGDQLLGVIKSLIRVLMALLHPAKFYSVRNQILSSNFHKINMALSIAFLHESIVALQKQE